VTHNTELY